MGGLTAISLNIKLASMLACSRQLMFQYFDDEFITMAITSWDVVGDLVCPLSCTIDGIPLIP